MDPSVKNLLASDPANLGWVQAGSKPLAAPTPAGFQRPLSLTSPQMLGDDVRLLQQRLQALGYDEVGPADGIFGRLTDAAVRHFQRDHQLLADGIVGPVTWAAVSETPSATPENVTPEPAQIKPAASPAPAAVTFPLPAGELALDVASDGVRLGYIGGRDSSLQSVLLPK